MSNPTPGEWFADLKFLDPRIMGTHAATGETFVIAKIISYIGAQDEANANAQVMAVSKDLLKALIAADSALRHHPGSDNRSNDDAQLATLAIARATGQEQVSISGKAAIPAEDFNTVVTANTFGPAFHCPMCGTTTLHRNSPHDRYKVICRTCGDEHDHLPF